MQQRFVFYTAYVLSGSDDGSVFEKNGIKSDHAPIQEASKVCL